MSDRGVRPGLRRVAIGPLDEPGDEPALLAVIRDEIRAGGPMTFARFMELALYDPTLGYYATGTRGPGRAADFLTAPESHPIFGWAIAAQLEEAWDRLGRPARFVVREFGAGTGALAAGILEGLDRSGSPLRQAIRYRIAERGRDRERQVQRTTGRSWARPTPWKRTAVTPSTAPSSPTRSSTRCPFTVSSAGRATARLLESFVDLDERGGLIEVTGAPSSPALANRLDGEGVRLAPGQAAEICLELDAWLASAASGLRRGLALLIDYGHPAPALYDPGRGSLLRAYVGHRVHDDPFRNVGRQDLTAHVDLTAVERAAAACGLEHLGTTSQSEFLAGLGIAELLVSLQEGSVSELGAYLEARSAVVRLLDPAATGRFAVLLFGRGMPAEPPLRGLSFRLPRRG